MKKKTCLLRAIACLLCLLTASNVAWAVTIEVPTEGTLEKVIDDSDEPSFPTLKIVGRLNATDIAYLRTGASRLASIKVLDLSDVTLVSGDEPYCTIGEDVSGETMNYSTSIFYISDENREEHTKSGNMMGGGNYTHKYYSNCLAGAFAKMKYNQVVLPKGQKEIGNYAFFNCENLTSVVLDGNLECIGDVAFEGCSSLQDMDLSHVVEMGYRAFSACPLFRGNEEGVVNLSSLNKIESSAFSNPQKNTCIKSVIFSDNLTEIGSSAFYYCTSLESIDLPEGLLTIGDRAFYYCKSLSNVTIPSTVTSFGAHAFDGTPFIGTLPEDNGVVYLGTIALTSRNASFDLVIREGTTEIGNDFCRNARNLKSIQLPSTLKRIGNSAFSEASQLTSITLPEGLEEIGDDAFYYCSGLTSLELPSTLKEIGLRAFYRCYGIESVELPDSLESIGTGAFSGCNISGVVTVPASVKRLGTGALTGNNIWQIRYNAVDAKNEGTYAIFNAERVIIGANVRSLPDYMFVNETKLKRVTFEERTDDAELIFGKNCFAWTGITEIELPKGKIEIEGGAFSNTNLASFSTLGVVTRIGDSGDGRGAFSGTKVTEFIVPDGLTYAGDYAFSGCSELTTAHLGNSVKHIGRDAFSSCSALTDLQLGEQVDSIGQYAFYGCSNLRSISIPQGVTVIEENTFGNCQMLKEVVIPNSVKKIGKNAFYNCINLKVRLPEGVEEIGEEAFSGCNFNEFTLPSTIKTLGKRFLGSSYNYANPNMTDIYSLIKEPFEMSEYDYPFSTAYLTSPSYKDVSHYARCVLHVPSGSIQLYRNTYPWSRFKTIVEIEEDENNYALTAEDISCKQGRTETLVVNLKNKEALVGLQFDMTLPPGVSVAQDKDNKQPVVLTDRGSKHRVMYNKTGNGKYTFVIMSIDGTSMRGSEGELIKIPLSVGFDATEGEQKISFDLIFTTTVYGKTRYVKSNTATLTVIDAGYIPGDVNGDGIVNIADAIAVANHILNKQNHGNFIFEAADMNNDGIISLTDIIQVINAILKK